ncbi:uncharacterized protein LACBIDRAFT_329152 [Laccaria bicolor S238N-H82]|uniref:Predicted protein n=1 Tax=Laccaria bicolor (strain S238N-H82 / ATCC MYA-4686) TaxID=486041 RepID=B0DH81_LACBS|nr:uncharacterized protein LACBIDRAFT_329152 [Laccaria bicolor S238N-H82]EDR05970.1 predicted protein [Laccaria bicolor S238N-H82]|eukprot:XP_001883258.1 predicted protein [Laccaria bicolor S238N-H82]
MPEKKTTSKKKPVSQALPAPASASTTLAATSSPPPATEESIAKLIALATSLPDSPLGLVWKHAFEQGSQEGFKRGAAFFKDMDVKQAFREGADQGQIVGILAEREVWEVEGHGQWCFDKPLTCFSCNIGLPEGHSCTANKLDTIVQVDSVEARPPSVKAAIQVSATHHASSSQTGPPPLLVNAETQAQPWISLLLLQLLLPWIPQLLIGLKTPLPYPLLPYS